MRKKTNHFNGFVSHFVEHNVRRYERSEAMSRAIEVVHIFGNMHVILMFSQETIIHMVFFEQVFMWKPIQHLHYQVHS